MVRTRRKETTGLGMIKPTSFYANEDEKIKFNWFFYELSMAIYDHMKSDIGSRLKRQKIRDEALAEFSIYYSKGMKDAILQKLSGKIEAICISYVPIVSYFPNLNDDLINKMTDVVSDAWDEVLSFCEVCPNRCISEKEAYCTLFNEKSLFK